MPTINRTYRDEGRYKTAHSFDTADLASVAKLNDWALNRIIKLQEKAAH